MQKTKHSDNIYMNYALSEARKAFEAEEVPVGAVIVAGDRIIASAHNLTEQLCDPTAHAEMQAITSASAYLGSKYLKGCTLYVTLEPCPMCAAALYWAQIDRVVYGASDDKMGYSLVPKNLMHPKTVVTKGICQVECAELMSRFFLKLRDRSSR